MITLPTATDPTEDLADWVELQALKSRDRSFSAASLVKLIRRTGSTDAVAFAHGDSGSEVSQSIAQDAFAEIDNRLKACGVGAYPFEVEKGLLRVRPNPESFPYSLLLLMSVEVDRKHPVWTAGIPCCGWIANQLCGPWAIGIMAAPRRGSLVLSRPMRVP